MNKHSVIVIIASIVIAAPFVYSGLNVLSIENLQFAGMEQGNFRYFDLIGEGQIAVCNNMPIQVIIDSLKISEYFDGEVFGTYETSKISIPGSSSIAVDGTFLSENYESAQYYAFHYDSMFKGEQIIRIDPRKLSVQMEMDTSIIGIIPYTVSKQYSGWDFWNLMNGIDTEFTCKV